MGKVEKVVVLSVLLVISIILAVSLSTSDETPREREATDGRAERFATLTPRPAATDLAALQGTDGRTEGRTDGRTGAPVEASAPREVVPVELSRPAPQAQRPTEQPSESRGERGNTGFLTSAVSPEGSRTATPADGSPPLPGDSDLKTSVGLEATVNPDYMVYRCRAGDTFENVAGKLYGDRAMASLLRRYNEGLVQLTSGREILIPVRDDGGFTGDEYTVVEGDSLWIISKKVFGKGSRWSELYDANHDVLASPESLMPGMVLRLP